MLSTDGRDTQKSGRGHAGAASDMEEANSDDPLTDEPTTPPYVTLVIISLITALFLAMTVTGHGDVRLVAIQFGAKDNALIYQGQYWRLITPIFLHGNWLHLLVNGYSLYALGGSMERIYGPKKYLLIFLAAGIAGNLLSYKLSPTLSLGASGALYGLVGAGLVFPLRFRSLIPPDARASILRQLALVAIINLPIGFLLRGIIDNWCHIGGLLGGAFVALFLLPDVLELDPRPIFANGVITGLVILAVGGVGAAWICQWNWVRESSPVVLITYYAPPPAWWTISLPPRWRYSNGSWQAREGATIRVTEQVLGYHAAPLSIHTTAPGTFLMDGEIDGRHGWYLATKQRLEYRIPIYDRVFSLTLDSKGPISQRTRSDFMLIAGSVRFIRPPFASAPSPVTD